MQKFTVLLIDDMPQEHDLYVECLEGDVERSYHFLHAYNGSQGEHMYVPGKVDCIIIDYMMPDANGIEVLKKLVQQHGNIPAIMMTGEGDERIAAEALLNGAQEYLPKRSATSRSMHRTIARAIERYRMMERLESYSKELERSNQDLERFANVVAHDMKSPLRSIIQHLELVKDHNAHLDESSLKSIDFAVEGALCLRNLIDAVFEYSRVGFEQGSYHLIDCNQVLEGVKGNLASQIKESGAVITHDPLPQIAAVGMQIMQLLQNLIGNAIKFCKTTPHIHISAQQEKGQWLFSVRDNGIGIASYGREKIFTIFKRLHSERDYPGTGVGLAICERVIRNHNGRIWVESEPGKGSVFYFTLPLHEPVAQEKAA